MPCPSTSAFPRRWKECNENPLKINNLRPSEYSGPPVSLFHPAFSQFLADYHNYGLDVPADSVPLKKAIVETKTSVCSTDQLTQSHLYRLR